MTDLDWNRYPTLLNVKHLAEIYARKEGGVRWGLRTRSPKLPVPCQSRPYKCRKSDVKRHFERMSA